MGLHSSDNRHMVSTHGSVAPKGTKSFKLGLGQIGLYTKDSVNALENAAGIAKNQRLVLRQGKNGFDGRSSSSKNTSTVPFTLNTVQKVTIGMPKVAEQKVDYLRVGWDGIHDETSLKFFKGDSWEMNLHFEGAPLSMFNSMGKYEITVPVITEGPDYGPCLEQEDLCEPMTCQSKTIEIVESIKNREFPTGQKVSEYFDVYPIFSTPSTNATVEYTQYCLEYCGFGDDNELANVSAQYPGLDVTRDTLTGKFVVMVPTSEGAPADYEVSMNSILKGCDDCPDGYDAIEGGFVYAVQLEDDGEDLSSVVQALPGAVEDSAKKTGQDFGVGYYIVATDDKLTADEIDTFINGDGEEAEGNPTATVVYAGETQDLCQNPTVTTEAWTACGTCEVSEGTYRIMVTDDCNGTRLADLQAKYPELEITEVADPAPANCVRLYETTVVSDFSCSEGCNSAIVEQVFNTEAPEPFNMYSHWYPVAPEADVAGVSCGFEIKAKPFIINPSEELSNKLPFMATSMRITSVSGGYAMDYSLSYKKPSIVNVLVLDRAQDLDNLGGHLRDFEKRGQYYFTGEPYDEYLIGREFRGTKSKLKGLEQYADISITIHELKPHSMNKATPKAMTYHVLVPVGKTAELEALFTSIAGEAGAEVAYI